MSTRIPVPTKLFFLNTGVITPNPHYRRRWEANKEYGFVSAGHNKKSGEAIQRLKADDVVCAYISKYGFVGIGEIKGEVKPIGESFLNTPNPIQDWPVTNHENENGLFTQMGNKELQEYVVKIKWIKWPAFEIVTKMINPNKPETIKFCSTQGKGLDIYRCLL